MKILVIRRDNIGDLVCTTPLLHALRQAMPESHIAVLVNSYNRAVLLDNPDIDELFTYDKLKHKESIAGKIAAIFARIHLFVKLRRRRFDVAILAKSGFDPHALRMARGSGARQILGFSPDGKPHPKELTIPVLANNPQCRHEVEVVAQLGEHFGALSPPGKLRLFPNKALQATFRQACTKNAQVKRWLALHISAREKTRQWPAEKFVELVQILGSDARFSDLGFLLLWSPGAADNPRHPGDDEKAAYILQHTKQFSVIPLGTARLEELIAGTAICNGFVGADGGAMHIAAGVGIPVAALFENSDYKRQHWYPWQVPHRLLQPATFAVEDIEVTDVAAAVRELMALPNTATTA